MGDRDSEQASAAAKPRKVPHATGLGRFVLEGFDRRSAAAFVLLVSLASSVGYRWSDLVDWEGNMDWLLAGIWVSMATLICWRVSPRRDLVLLVTGLCGGAVIEWWGTTTELWRYFTDERPPPWILPAWPCAAIAIDRSAVLLDRVVTGVGVRGSPRGFRVAYWLVVPAFVAWMIHFLAPAIHEPASIAVVMIMVVVTARAGEPRQDMVLFAAGSFLGVFLETWGTTRECWTYYTLETPPAVAVVAHGFAAVAFARAASVGLGLLGRVRREKPDPAGAMELS